MWSFVNTRVDKKRGDREDVTKKFERSHAPIQFFTFGFAFLRDVRNRDR